jgi:predicted RNA-binding protein associated with RNAse of E/G family
MTKIKVVKLDHDGHVVFEYQGELVAQGKDWVCVEAHFNRDLLRDYVRFRVGDRMTEWHYTDRWYNIFRIEDVDDKRLKGWYCNITRPAVIDWNASPPSVIAEDLALDVFISPTGKFWVLDEDEFAALDLSEDERRAAWNTVDQLRKLANDRSAPFDEIVLD